MARSKKPPRSSPQSSEGKSPPRPAFPLKINHARIFALAAAADAADELAEATSAPLPGSKTTDPVQALGEELRLLRAEVASVAAPVASPPNVLAQMIREEIVAALPGLIREAIAEVAPTAAVPAGPSALEVKTWTANELNGLLPVLSAVEPPDYVNDNRKLADRLSLKAFNAGLVSGITPKQFFILLAAEVRDFVFRIASQATSPGAVAPGEATPAPFDTLRNIAARIELSEPVDLRADLGMLTPLTAIHHPREVAHFSTIFARLERVSKTVAAYYRLRVFAGRNDDEIAALTGDAREQVADRLKDFVKLLEDEIETASR